MTDPVPAAVVEAYLRWCGDRLDRQYELLVQVKEQEAQFARLIELAREVNGLRADRDAQTIRRQEATIARLQAQLDEERLRPGAFRPVSAHSLFKAAPSRPKQRAAEMQEEAVLPEGRDSATKDDP